MATNKETLMQLQRDASSGALAKASTETLEEYAAALCNSNAYATMGKDEFPQICETVRIHLLRAHINSLQRHITDLNAKNSLTQYLVIALTLASLIGTAVQVWYAVKADVISATEAKPIAAQQQQPIQPAASASSVLSGHEPASLK